MSVQSASRHESVSQEEEDDEEFIKESTELAKSFTELFISTQSTPSSVTKSPLVDHENKLATTVSTGEAYVGPITVDVPAPAVAIAGSLKVLAQRMDDHMMESKFTKSQTAVLENHSRTIWDVVYKDFHDIMWGVFTSLDESVLERSSGWEMAALVYRGVAGLVRDLRQQSGGKNDGSITREETLQGYVGNFMEDIGLMTWINGQGGLSQWGNDQRERYRIPLRNATGTAV